MTRPADRLQARSDRNAAVKLFRFQQTIVRRVKVITLNVETGERQAVARGFFRMFVRSGDFAHPLAQTNRTRAALQRCLQALHRAIGRAVLDKQVSIKKSRFDFANRFSVIVSHEVVEAKVYHKQFSPEANLSPGNGD
jgi:hypothetical protein